jgi:hypothetical protein
MRCDRAECLTEASMGSITEKRKKAPIAVEWANDQSAVLRRRRESRDTNIKLA